MSPILTTVSLTWCVVIGIWIWVKPNGGLTWKPMVLQSPITDNSGEAVWITPALSKTKNNCKVKVRLYDTNNLKVGSDTSDMVFAIAP